MSADLKRLARGTAIYGIGGLLTRLINFFLLPIFTAYLTPADYGIISLLAMMSYMLTQLFSLGFGTSLGVCYFDDAGDRWAGAAVWTSAALLFASAALLAALGFFFAAPISRVLFRTAVHGDLVVLTMFTTGLSVLSIPFTLHLQFQERAKLFVALSTASVLFSIGSGLYMVAVAGAGVRGLIQAGLAAQVVNLALFALAARGLPVRLDGRAARELLRHGIPMVPSFASLFLILQANRYILQHFRGIEEVGLYAVGYNIGMVMNLFVSAFGAAWTPYFLGFAGRRDEAREHFGKIATYYTLGFGTLALFFFVFSRPVILLMTQPSFHESFRVVGWAATSCFFVGAFSLLVPPMYFAKEVRYSSVIQALAAAGALLLNALLIPRFGAVGAAVSLVAGTFGMTALTHAWNARRGEAYLRIRIEWHRILAFAVLFAVCAAAASWNRSLGVAAELSFAGGLAGLVLATVFLQLTREERGKLLSYLRIPAGPRSAD